LVFWHIFKKIRRWGDEGDEENYKLWGLLIRRTLEHFGIEIEKTE
jgi:hypothetical protein